MINKILNLDQIKKTVLKLKKNKKKITLCHGVFDLLHVGHIKHFKKAKKLGDFLIVSITSSKFVNKGNNRPFFNDHLRLESVSALECVDAVILSNYPSASNVIKIIKPDFYVKGSDYKNIEDDITGKIKIENNLVKKFGGKTIYTEELIFSSSSLINKYSNVFNDEQKEYLDKLKKQFSFKDILKSVENIKELKVLVIGETIIDQYIFCEALGKSGKESYLVIKEILEEDYLGGAAAVAKHIATFCSKVNFLSILGDNKKYNFFVNKKLGKKINKNFIYKKDSPTIVKKRFIDYVNKNKLLGVYTINDKILNDHQEKQLYRYYKQAEADSDLVIIVDYGHGFLSEKFINKITLKKKKPIYLNAQVNSGNIGYHTLKKYKKIDTLVINENELRHEKRNRTDDISVIAKNLLKEMKLLNIIVTMGKNGALLINKKNNRVVSCPAFAKNIIDKVGSGDTMLSIISMLLKTKAPNEISLFLGSLAGASSVEFIGNSKHLDKKSFLKYAETTIK
jgi:rfaE bifunctional protein kinase chain/domain/rfaE bifunctional protein nucleotidyltransferase chain/domain